MEVCGILIVCAVVVLIVRIFFKRPPFLFLYSILTSFCFLVLHYQLYSPVLKITVPNNYAGPVALVLSNVKENILTVDTNGIGYITEWTYNHNYKSPIVVEPDGKDVSNRCVGYNPSSFWALTQSSSSKHKGEVLSLSFEIVAPTEKREKQYRTWDVDMVDTSKILK
jgi:hypothetical protein